MYALEAAPSELDFGRQGESNILAYVFDFSAWADEWPGGTASVTVTLPYSESVQPLTSPQVVVDGTTITVNVLENVTQTAGRGTMVIRYEAGPKKARSRVIDFLVEKGHDTALSTAPEPVQDWLKQYDLLTEIPGTAQVATMDDDGKITQIVHTDLTTSAVLRTDTIIYDGYLITQTRTLADGSYITVTTNTDTMEQTISNIVEGA